MAYAEAADWYNPRHYKPKDGAGLFLLHWYTCPMCQHSFGRNPRRAFLASRPSAEEVATFERIWPLIIARMQNN